MSFDCVGADTPAKAEPSLKAVTDSWKDVKLTKGSPGNEDGPSLRPSDLVVSDQRLDELVRNRKRLQTPEKSTSSTKKIASGAGIIALAVALSLLPFGIFWAVIKSATKGR